MKMKIQFVKDCGHHKAGKVEEASRLAADQYIAGGFAVVYKEPKPEPAPKPEPKPEPKPAPKKKAQKAKKE